jgi:hypothetical protein
VIEVVRIEPTASLPRRASRVLETIVATAPVGSGPIHLIGHSSGGLDARLVVAPDVALPGIDGGDHVVDRIRTVVSVSTPHHGTPVASFFASLLGQQLLRLLSLSTMYVLRFGHLPLSVVLKLGAVFARLDRHTGINSALLDQLFGQLLADFSVERRAAIEAFFGEVGRDQALLPQITPEAMDVFNATTRTRPGVRCGSVLSKARRPGVRSTLAAGLDPSAQATHAIYHGLYRLAAGMPSSAVPRFAAAQVEALRSAYGDVPEASANDGLVPTLSQVWGDVVHAAHGDHLDVVGHFGDLSLVPPHYDWLATGTGFDRARFDALWTDVVRYLAA